MRCLESQQKVRVGYPPQPLRRFHMLPRGDELPLRRQHDREVATHGHHPGASTSPDCEAETGNPRSVDTVPGTAVALEPSAEILAKKIGGRILRNNTFVPRDLYDLVIARRSEPDALTCALRCFAPDLLQQIADELRHLPFDWMDTHPVSVAAPSDPDAARRAPGTVRG